MWGKILVGCAVGVGAVAIAPFTGGGSLLAGATLLSSLAGVGTVAAATVAGLTGGAVGGAIADIEDEEKQALKDEGNAEGRAHAQEKIKKIENKLHLALTKLKTHDKHFKAIIALEAVGVACASCDGDFSGNEKKEIEEFVRGMLAQNIPEDVKEKIQTIYDNPPNVKEAFILAQESGIELDIYEELVQFVMEIDGIKEEERVFVQAWKQLKAA